MYAIYKAFRLIFPATYVCLCLCIVHKHVFKNVYRHTHVPIGKMKCSKKNVFAYFRILEHSFNAAPCVPAGLLSASGGRVVGVSKAISRARTAQHQESLDGQRSYCGSFLPSGSRFALALENSNNRVILNT